mmetsp:Transcript_15229/g.41938  ORF Transcript_15229/g.41938 Transcript_15229/m.41938 type:complete len:272 (+) Transcript_15229:294-1109(+)
MWDRAVTRERHRMVSNASTKSAKDEGEGSRNDDKAPLNGGRNAGGNAEIHRDSRTTASRMAAAGEGADDEEATWHAGNSTSPSQSSNLARRFAPCAAVPAMHKREPSPRTTASPPSAPPPPASAPGLTRNGAYSCRPASINMHPTGTLKPSCTAAAGAASNTDLSAATASLESLSSARAAEAEGDELELPPAHGSSTPATGSAPAAAARARAAAVAAASRKRWPEVRPCLTTKLRPAKASTAESAAAARVVVAPAARGSSSGSQGLRSSAS